MMLPVGKPRNLSGRLFDSPRGDVRMGKHTYLLIALTLSTVLFVFQSTGYCGAPLTIVTHNEMIPGGKDQIADLSKLQDDSQLREQLQVIEGELLLNPGDQLLLQRAAYLHFRIGWLYSRKKVRKEHYLRFFDLASKANEATGGQYYSSLLLAVSKAKIIEYLSHAEQVRVARDVVEEAKELIERGGSDPDPVHLLSWLNFEIGLVSSINKIFASLLFGGLPDGMTVDNAHTLMEQLIKIRPSYSVYRYDLGYYYWRVGKMEKALELFKQVLTMAPQTPEEHVYQEKAADKLNKIQQQRSEYN